MKTKRFSILFALFLSIVTMLSSCASKESSVAESAPLLKEATIATPFSETTTTTLPETTTTAQITTTAAATTSAAPSQPAVVSITTTPPPAITDKDVTTPVISQMTAPAVTAPLVTLAPLVTTTAPVTTAEPIQVRLTPIASTYTYNNLSADKKIVYSKILQAARSCASTVIFDNAPSIETVTDIYSIIYTEEINLQFLSQSFKYGSNPVSKLQISYTYPTDTINSINVQTEAKANEIISQITPTMTAYDIVKYFHDTIIKNCVYDDSAEFASTAYGALVKGRALCQGYSHAMSLLCNKVGIENAYITGYAGEEHMWNMVKLDGDWYNIDVTWDDLDKADRPDFIVYDYFNVTDADLSARQIYPGYVPLPVSTATADNYYVYNGLVANTLADAQQILYNEYINVANANGRYVSLKCANAQVYDQVCQELITNQGIFTIQAQANTQAVNKFNPATLNLIKDGDMFVINFIIIY